MMFFALVVVVVFSFAFEREDSRPVMGGLIWVAFLFSTTMALNQSWARELRNGVLDAYRVSPAPAEALFLGKCIGNFILVMLLECLMAPLFVVFYNLSSVGPLWQLVLIALLGTWALVVNGTFFAAMSIRTRNRELMLPLLLLPISHPGGDQHGDGHGPGAHRRGIARGTVEISGRILRDLYHRVLPAV